MGGRIIFTAMTLYGYTVYLVPNRDRQAEKTGPVGGRAWMWGWGGVRIARRPLHVTTLPR